MKGQNTWSYAPYKPLLTDIGDIYICRVAPDVDSIRLEWLQTGDALYQVYYRKREDESFVLAGETAENGFTLCALKTDTDYAFYVAVGDKKSRVRLARTGKPIGTVVNYLHPDDEAYSYSGRYLCSPSYLRHPDGFLLASMDLYQDGAPQNLTLIYRSDDDGKSWHYVSELMPCFWGKMFLHNGDIYMLAVSTEYGDLLIGKSSDGGKTFSAPVALLRGSNGKAGNTGVHKNPQNVLIHKGRIYNTMEWGSWKNKEYCHAAMVMSCDVGDDLMVPENWSFSEPLKFDRFASELEGLGNATMTIEGTLTVAPDGSLLDVMRFGKRGKAIAYKVNTEDHDAPLSYYGCINFTANFSKFMMKYDAVSGKYYSVATKLYEGCHESNRNLLSLMASDNLTDWYVVCDLHDYRDADPAKVGFQYVDFEIEGDDIVYLCRTALNGAHNYHDSNYSTFHRIENFRDI